MYFIHDGFLISYLNIDVSSLRHNFSINTSNIPYRVDAINRLYEYVIWLII